jgi:hypothetical protein
MATDTGIPRIVLVRALTTRISEAGGSDMANSPLQVSFAADVVVYRLELYVPILPTGTYAWQVRNLRVYDSIHIPSTRISQLSFNTSSISDPSGLVAFST